MAEIITIDDLPNDVKSHELVLAMVAGANAKASRVAPCLSEAPTDDQLAEARLVLVGAVKRWADAGSGAFSQTTQSAGPFALGQTVDTRQRTGFNLWPSEITDLQAICSDGTAGRQAFALDTAVGTSLAGHSPYCDLHFGGATCSCGYALTGVAPIYEPY